MPLNFSPSIATNFRFIKLGIALGMINTMVAAPPTALTTEQLTELNQLAAPTYGKIQPLQQAAGKSLQDDADRSAQADTKMHAFMKKNGQGHLLAQAATTTPPKPKPAPADPKKKIRTLKVECDGGLYFDSEDGVLAYFKNIRLTEARFKLTCSDELKVFLEQKPAKSKAKKDNKTTPAADSDAGDKNSTNNNAKDDKKAKEKEDKGLSSFGSLKRIVATGNVKVVQKDDKGRLFIASGGKASYDAKTKEIILQGGYPRLQQSANQYLQAKSPGAWIKIEENGKIITSQSNWEMETITENTSTKKPTPTTP